MWYCFPEFVVNADEIVEFKANLDGFEGYNPSIHYDLKLEKDGVSVAVASSVEDDTFDALGLLYSSKVTGASSNFRFCMMSFGANRTIDYRRLQWGYTRKAPGSLN